MIRARNDGTGYAEIARIFGKPTEAAARMAVNRAIAKLAKAMLKRQ
jgi:hypothetical protein